MIFFLSLFLAEIVRESEFWEALELAFGSISGRSLASDLYLEEVESTAVEALGRGIPVEQIWVALVRESGVDESVRWIHRRPKKNKK